MFERDAKCSVVFTKNEGRTGLNLHAAGTVINALAGALVKLMAKEGIYFTTRTARSSSG